METKIVKKFDFFSRLVDKIFISIIESYFSTVLYKEFYVRANFDSA